MDWMTVEGFSVNELFVEQFVLGMQAFRMQIRAWPTAYADDELRRIEEPTLLLVGEQEVICDPYAAVHRGRKLIPEIEAEVVPDAGHGLPMERPALVDERVLDFLHR
jgi:pimeloyl-ACP methyl ester carboxylesterase